MSDQKPYTPTEIDDTEDRMGSMEPLDFDQRRDERRAASATRCRPRKSPISSRRSGRPRPA